ncbi:MAG: zinc and cadmium transporter [Candidatus Saccharimonadales bacterium]|jgi:zinc and cadmium transporter
MLQVLFYSLIGGVVSLIGGALLIRNKKSAERLAKHATPFAAGVLLAAAFGDLLPEALEQGTDNRSVMMAALFGILGFFILERFVRWFHHHHEHEGKDKSPSSMIIIGDTLHNALDGIAIGAAFLIDTPTGVITTAAVAAHEIPQEIGDIGLLLRNGMQKNKVLLANFLSALATVVTALLTFSIGDDANFPLPALLAITAGFFIYIAASDIIPEIHEKLKGDETDYRPWLLLAGAGLILVVSPITHDYIENRSSHAIEHAIEHKEYIVASGDIVPTVTLSPELTAAGLNLRTQVTDFTFTPEKEGEQAAAAEGHAHLYVNGVKITRIYSEWAFVPAGILPSHFDQITVTLSNNDHSEYHDQTGTAVGASHSVQSIDSNGESHSHEDEDTHKENSDTDHHTN